MREQVLRDFFEGRSSGAELERDVAGSTQGTGPKASVVSIEDMDNDFVVTADMAVRLCEAVIREELSPGALHTIGFALMASDRFQWDGGDDEVLASVIADWSCPEVNYPLTLENVQRFRAWLMKTDQYPETAAHQRWGQPNFGHRKEIHPSLVETHKTLARLWHTMFKISR